MRILIVEDEKRLADAIAQILAEQKYMVDTVGNGKDGYDFAISGIYDCIVLDIMLPLMNGFDVCSSLRSAGVSTPIIMLTAKDSIQDKVHGLDLGADDYMTKPFAAEELLARIRTLCRRKGEVILEEMRFCDIVFNISTNELRCDASAKNVRLNFKESQMLRILLAKPDVIISKEELITKIWGYDSDAGDNNVEAYVSFLRKKLNFIGSKTQILSIKKLGYRLEAGNGQ